MRSGPWAVAALLCATVHATAPPIAAVDKPNIVMVIVDDWAWNAVGYHGKDGLNSGEIATPHIDRLVQNGVELNRHYVHYNGSGTRTSFQTGRLPIHVQSGTPSPCSEEAGIPQNMTGIAQKMKAGGYQTHFVGKWDCGMATVKSTPKGRGYDSSLNFFSRRNWAYSVDQWKGPPPDPRAIPACELPECVKDLWDTTGPANDTLIGHEEELFRNRFMETIGAAGILGADPLFLVYASKLAGYPMEPPFKYQQKFSFISDNRQRMMYAAMVSYLDDQIGSLVSALEAKGLWENTVMVVTSDNGGYVADTGDCAATLNGLACFSGESGGNNYPLRGGKDSAFEGGIRVNTFVSGGFLPKEVWGTQVNEPIHIADWYSTFCHLAGVSPVDDEASNSELPPIDSLNVWELVSGKTSVAPRKTILVNENVLVHGRYKLMRGVQKIAGFSTQFYPNATTAGHELSGITVDCKDGCLYDVVDDPSEHRDIAKAYPDVVTELVTLMHKLNKTIWRRPTPDDDPACMKAAVERYHGFLGPWKL